MHTVEVLPDCFEKHSILFKENRREFDKHLEKFAEFDWYAAAILLFGELLE